MLETLKLLGRRGALNVVITTPDANGARGVLVCLHGGPGGDMHGPEGVFTELADLALRKSFATVQFDMYGAGNSDGTAEEICLASQLEDFNDILTYVSERFPVPIHIVGESMGATVAALDWKTEAASYILLWPAFDLRDTDLRPYFASDWKQQICTKGVINDNGVVIGAAFYSELQEYDFSRCFPLPPNPCLIVHGRKDNSVPFHQSVKAFSQHNGTSVFYAHASADHGFKGASRPFMLEAVSEWLSRFIA